MELVVVLLLVVALCVVAEAVFDGVLVPTELIADTRYE